MDVVLAETVTALAHQLGSRLVTDEGRGGRTSGCSQAEIVRLRGSAWTGSSIVERTPAPIIEVGIRLTYRYYHSSVVHQILTYRARNAAGRDSQLGAGIRVGMAISTTLARTAVDETVIQVNDDRCWLYAAVDPATDQLHHVRLFHGQNTERPLSFLRELTATPPVEDATFLVDAARCLRAALDRLGLDYRVGLHDDAPTSNVSSAR